MGNSAVPKAGPARGTRKPVETPAGALVLGGSYAGLLTAAVLSDFFPQVTILEKDKVEPAPTPRRGQPQALHVHALLACGLKALEDILPGIVDDLVTQGVEFGDMAGDVLWHEAGGYRVRFSSGLKAAFASRAMLEWCIRKRVAALPNVHILDGISVSGLIVDSSSDRIRGATSRRTGDREPLRFHGAELTVDATGRGSRSPRWLQELGYSRPPKSVVTSGIGYASREYHRKPADPKSPKVIVVGPEPPDNARTGHLFPIEGDRWILSLSGWGGDHPPRTERGFMEFARSLAAPDIFHVVSELKPVSDIRVLKYPISRRDHYEKARRLPSRYLVVGDALSSINPIYGQGMTVAALQVKNLRGLLARGTRLDHIGRFHFRAAASVASRAWDFAVGGDFEFPSTQGPRPFGAPFFNFYMRALNRATHHDPNVYRAFLQVMNLQASAWHLLRPCTFLRVLFGAKFPEDPKQLHYWAMRHGSSRY